MRAPTSTYRLQITADLDLFEAARLLPYLHDLGADWVYLSPILEAEPGSTHGYDVIRHDRIDPARGGAEGLAALSAEARRLGMGVLVDIVPNHVGVATPSEDPWWWDVLKHGRESEHAPAFDIDWDATHQKLQIPVVGDDDEHAIEVLVEEGEVRYHDNRFPLAPGTTTLEEQHYELVNWREADEGLNYRRFFAVNTLAAVRVEEPEVFTDTHVEIKRWFDEGLVDGLRVDHPDGLRDPGGYLRDLAELTGDAYVLVEKILEPGEQLLTSWATAGTTGYDALAHVDRVLTDPAGEEPLSALEDRLRGASVDWHEMVHDNKRTVADGILNSEVRRIVRDLRRHLPVVPAFRAEDAISELLACFPVYRSYLPEGREHLEQAFAEARRRRPDLTLTFARIEPWMFDPDLAAAKRFQQTSGMVMAKGVEDCSFYRWSRLTSLNEVGGDPSIFSLALPDFHREMADRQRHWPLAMTTLSTHDTKRGEDVRARITALAEIPSAWEAALDSLLSLVPLPDPGFGSLLWQAVVGAWPASRERLHGYAEKAMREAGDRTTWTEPDEAYEATVHAAVDAAFDSADVRSVIEGLLEQVVLPGWSNALAAKLLALTMPGVPDVYQGSELWEQSLVDPDNRRFVDFDARRTLLDSRDWSAPTAAVDDPGSAKLHVTATALRLRRDRPELFASYDGVAASGSAADHVVAFDRGGALTVATRLPVGLAAGGGWGETTLDLPPGTWTDALGSWSGSGAAPLADLLADLPVALLVKES